MPNRSILILANSVKKSPGRCIAGREVDLAKPKMVFGPWMRPVSPDGEAKEGELIPCRHCTLQQGGMPAVLDIVEVPVTSKRADPGQPENWEVDSGVRWNRIKTVSAKNIGSLAETPENLWIDGGERRDRISEQSQRDRVDSPSLVLIQPSRFHVRMWTEFNPYKGYEQRKTKGVFTYADIEYALSITDDAFTARYCPHQQDGERHELDLAFGDECVLCVSLSAPFCGYHYKLIASVIPIQ